MMTLAVIGVLAALAAGCGGGGSSSGSGSEEQASVAVATSSLGRAAYVKKVDAACLKAKKKAFAELGAFQQNAPGPKSGPRYAANALKAVMLPIVEAQTAAISETGAPKADKAKIEAIVAGREQAIEEAQELEAVKTATDYEGFFAKAEKELQQYGVTTCNLHL
ncbi:MAG TPA: hypothetical protein VFN89_03285 [Solirubrobacterales bacterium]|nr:hypothetical protein [Solirubrobacterales bacterium]